MANNIHFHAEAHALSGKLVLPIEEQIKKQAFVQLEGRSEKLLLEGDELRKLQDKKGQENYLSQHAKNYRLENIISYSAAHTQVSLHRSKKDPDALVTLATSSVENLNVLNVVTADRVVAQISTTHRKGHYSPEVSFLGTHFENLRIARHKCEPYLNLDVCKRVLTGNEMRVGHDSDFQGSVEAQYGRLKARMKGFTYEQRKKMRFAADDSLIKTYHEGELKFADFANQATDAQKAGLDLKIGYSDWDGITCSLVEHVDIEGISAKTPDGKTVDLRLPGTAFGHVIHVHDFGTIFLAELRVNHNSYNLTMIRLELGCIAHGDVSIATCDVKGMGSAGAGNGGGLARDAGTHDRNGIEAPSTGRSPTGLQALTGEHEGAFSFQVWYGTNRSFKDFRNPERGFTSKPEIDGAVHYGSCIVYIPKSHKFGSTGTSWWNRWRKLKFEDDHLKILERHPSENAEDFFSDIRQRIADLGPLDRQILVYLHGYCVSFDEAALRAAQIGFDLKAVGITAFFSWPSCGSVRSYLADRERIAASELAITAFLKRLTRDTGAQAVHVIAHSMGNHGLARSIQRIVSDSSMSGVRFGQIILAAPDIEVSLFRDLAAAYPKISQRTTMYVSARDRALKMSKFLQDCDRAGFCPPITVVPDIDTVEVTNIDLTLLGHAYYAEAEPVLYDMNQVLTSTSSPGRRLRTEPAGGRGQPMYWVIRK